MNAELITATDFENDELFELGQLPWRDLEIITTPAIIEELDEFFDDAEKYCEVVTILTIDESDFYDEIFSRWQCSGPKSIDLSTRDKLGIWLNKEKLECRFSEDSDIWPSQDEASVALFTSGWDFITSFKKHRNDFTIDCDECLETFTIGETVQVDDNDESIRCCSDCKIRRL